MALATGSFSFARILLIITSLLTGPTQPPLFCLGFLHNGHDYRTIMRKWLRSFRTTTCITGKTDTTSARASIPPGIRASARMLGCQRQQLQENKQSWELEASNADFLPPWKRGSPQGGDMAYIQVSIHRQMNTFTAIRNVGGLDCVRDVYVCTTDKTVHDHGDPMDSSLCRTSSSSTTTTTTFWYVGKVAFAGVSVQQAIARQWNLIQEHATRLRPVELGRSFGTLQIYVAPGDSEVLVVNGMVKSLQHVVLDATRNHDDDDDDDQDHVAAWLSAGSMVSLKECGFLCEVVTNMGTGLCVVRAVDGSVLSNKDQ